MIKYQNFENKAELLLIEWMEPKRHMYMRANHDKNKRKMEALNKFNKVRLINFYYHKDIIYFIT